VFATGADFITQSKQGEMDEAWQRALVDLLGATLRLPSSQAWITLDYIRDVMNDDSKSEGFDKVRDLVFSRPKDRK